LALAAGIHAAIFVANPSFLVSVPEKTVVRSHLDLFFGRPDIIDADGSGVSPDDSLLAFQVAIHSARVALLRDWPAAYRAYGIGGSASLDLNLDSLGRVMSASVVESSGDDTKDQAFERMALFFEYRWTPREAGGSGFRILQPISVEPAVVPFEIDLAGSGGEGKGSAGSLHEGRL